MLLPMQIQNLSGFSGVNVCYWLTSLGISSADALCKRVQKKRDSICTWIFEVRQGKVVVRWRRDVNCGKNSDENFLLLLFCCLATERKMSLGSCMCILDIMKECNFERWQPNRPREKNHRRKLMSPSIILWKMKNKRHDSGGWSGCFVWSQKTSCISLSSPFPLIFFLSSTAQPQGATHTHEYIW